MITAEQLQTMPANTRAGLLVLDQNRVLSDRTPEQLGEIADTILTRYLAGEIIGDIAADMGISQRTGYALIVRHRPEQWRDCQAAGALASYEQACIAQDNDSAEYDVAQVARINARVKRCQWELERTLRRLYGAETTQVNIAAGGNVAVQIVAYGAAPSPGLVPTPEPAPIEHAINDIEQHGEGC